MCSNGRWLEPFPLKLYRPPTGDCNAKSTEIVKIGIRGERRNPQMASASGGRGNGG
jgi:hypothetical protein